MRKIVVGVMLFVVVTAVVPAVVFAADELNEVRLNTIRANCVAAQSTIQRIGRNDTTSRINRGRDYDAVLRLFYAMNTRLSANNITEPKLAEITKSFETELQNFRSRYNTYNGNYKASVDINCVSRPADFYSSLDKTRDSRQEINNSIRKLNELIDNYRTVIAELQL